MAFLDINDSQQRVINQPELMLSGNSYIEL